MFFSVSFFKSVTAVNVKTIGNNHHGLQTEFGKRRIQIDKLPHALVARFVLVGGSGYRKAVYL